MPRNISSLEQKFEQSAQVFIVSCGPVRLPAILASLLVFTVFGSSARAQNPSEYAVKAAFLYTFAKFVDWPADAFMGPQDPMTLCILGEDPFGGDLDGAVKGKTVNGRQFAIRRIARVQEIKGCQIVFISSSEKKRVRNILASLHPAPVLTVGDVNDFSRCGGMITFKLDEDKVRFEINLAAAESVRLKISSKLMSVATVVKEDGGGKT